jgi:excisionase family DNA binding protein
MAENTEQGHNGAGKVTLSDPAYWATHGEILREALLDAARGTDSADLAPPDLELMRGPLKRARVLGHVVVDLMTALIPFHVGSPDDECLTLTVEEAAKRLGISRAFAYESVRRGDIPSIKIGRRVLVPKEALHRLLASADGDSRPAGDQ